MRVDVSFFNFIKRNLPAHKVQKGRVSLFYTFLAELDLLFSDWQLFRDEKVVEQNINHSRDSIRYWLRRQLSDSTIDIIEDVRASNFVLLSHVEGGVFVDLSDTTSGTDYVELGREGDTVEGELGADFAVISASTLNPKEKERASIIIERYRAAGVTYTLDYVQP